MKTDDLSVGQIVTVLTRRPRETVVPGLVGTQVVTIQDRSFMGDVLRIEAISLPYVAVTVLQMGAFRNHKAKMDMREVELALLSPEYVAVLTHE